MRKMYQFLWEPIFYARHAANCLVTVNRSGFTSRYPVVLYIPCTLPWGVGFREERVPPLAYQDAVVDKAYARPSQLRSALKAAVPVSPVLSAGEVGPGVFMQSSMIITLPLASDENLNENDFAPSTTSE